MTTRMTIPNPEFSVSTDAALRQALAGFRQLELALVFGSVARGTPRPDSDVDMAVACPHRALTVDETLDIVAALAQRLPDWSICNLAERACYRPTATVRSMSIR